MTGGHEFHGRGSPSCAAHLLLVLCGFEVCPNADLLETNVHNLVQKELDTMPVSVALLEDNAKGLTGDGFAPMRPTTAMSRALYCSREALYRCRCRPRCSPRSWDPTGLRIGCKRILIGFKRVLIGFGRILIGSERIRIGFKRILIGF